MTFKQELKRIVDAIGRTSWFIIRALYEIILWFFVPLTVLFNRHPRELCHIFKCDDMDYLDLFMFGVEIATVIFGFVIIVFELDYHETTGTRLFPIGEIIFFSHIVAAALLRGYLWFFADILEEEMR